jgi:hypothetical protein
LLYELRRGRLAIHPCSLDLSGSTLRFDKLQGILAKAKQHNTLYTNPGEMHSPLLATPLWKLH